MENIQDPEVEPKSKIRSIYLQYVRNIESIEIFFEKLSQKAVEEDNSISDAQKKYFEDSLRTSLGEEFYQEFKQKLKSENDTSGKLEFELIEEDTENEENENSITKNDNVLSKTINRDKLDTFFL